MAPPTPKFLGRFSIKGVSFLAPVFLAPPAVFFKAELAGAAAFLAAGLVVFFERGCTEQFLVRNVLIKAKAMLLR